MSLEINTQSFDLGMIRIEQATLQAAKTAVNDCVDDLVRISSNIAPIDKSTLRKSHTKSVRQTANGFEGEVAYSAVEKGKGRFNYALAMHEWVYTPSHGGSYAGYFVGRKYLERPLKQETPKYLQWIAEGIRGGIG